MNANIRVKDINGQRNTDLYAGLLLRRSLDYFDANNPQPVSAFKALWVSNQDPRHASDNYKQYRAALNADPSNSWAAKGRAARSTWTGEQMNDMGFDLITSIHTDKKGNVCTVFERSSVLRGIYAWTSRQRSKLYQS